MLMTSVSVHSDQITLPNEVREILAISDGDELDLSVHCGTIILKPKFRTEAIKQKTASLVTMIGKGQGAFKSPEDVDRFIRHERNQWD
jgi:AbrB family looped-hinge helix DNA binding protein